MTTSRGFISLGLILLLVIGLGILGGGWWYVSKQHQGTNPQSGVATTTAAGEETTATTRAVITDHVSAAIDPNSLMATSGTPTITGSASSITFVTIHIAGSGPGFAVVPVVNGHWSVTINSNVFDPSIFTTDVANSGIDYLANGKYTVDVYPGSLDATGIQASTRLVRGTLTVNINSNHASATIDKSSLSQTVSRYDGQPVITGTASNANAVDIYINGSDVSFAEVINGHWSATIPSKNLTFTTGSTWSIEVHDHYHGAILATGILTITGLTQ